MGTRRRLAWGAVVGLGAAFAIGVALPMVECWRIAGVLTHPGHSKPFDLKILESAPGTVTLSATRETLQPGRYGLQWRRRAGAAMDRGVLGGVVGGGHGTVRRALNSDHVPPVGDEARRLVVMWFADPKAAFGLDFDDIRYSGPLGPMPAWLVPGARPSWVIEIHGRASGRAEGLRALSVFHALGYPVLDIAYRNGADAPSSPDGCGHFGDTEWQDLDAAVAYALRAGSHGVILYGCSQGGGIVEAFLTRSPRAACVKAVILDCPALDWKAIFAYHVRRTGFPRLLVRPVERMMRLRSGFDLDRLDFAAAVRRQGGPRQPVLLFHGTADTTVPFAISARFARAWPALVRLVQVEGADHDESWNVDPEAYARAIGDFLAANDR